VTARRSYATVRLVHGYRDYATDPADSCRMTLCGLPLYRLVLGETFALIRGETQYGKGSVNCRDCEKALEAERAGRSS
jgi:hypothetical protein